MGRTCWGRPGPDCGQPATLPASQAGAILEGQSRIPSSVPTGGHTCPQSHTARPLAQFLFLACPYRVANTPGQSVPRPHTPPTTGSVSLPFRLPAVSQSSALGS